MRGGGTVAGLGGEGGLGVEVGEGPIEGVDSAAFAEGAGFGLVGAWLGALLVLLGWLPPKPNRFPPRFSSFFFSALDPPPSAGLGTRPHISERFFRAASSSSCRSRSGKFITWSATAPPISATVTVGFVTQRIRRETRFRIPPPRWPRLWAR